MTKTDELEILYKHLYQEIDKLKPHQAQHAKDIIRRIVIVELELEAQSNK